MASVLLANAAAVALLMLTVWAISLPLRDASIIDLAWGAGFVLIAWVTWSLTSVSGPSRTLLVSLTTVWGARLSLYLAWRNHGRPEDPRYGQMREHWGALFWIASLITVFAVQGVVMFVVALPLQLGILQSNSGWTLLHPVGITLWMVGLVFEAVGDWQLAQFKSNPDNEARVLDEGLWRYTRHPNYFGDFCVWWGLFTIALAGGAEWWTVVSPIVMSVFLINISGVSLLERDLKHRKPEYVDYIRRTSAFFPWPPQSTPGGSSSSADADLAK